MASGLQTFVAAVRSIATYVAVSLYVALIGTPLVFDVGVFLTVIGVVLTIVFTLADVALSEE